MKKFFLMLIVFLITLTFLLSSCTQQETEIQKTENSTIDYTDSSLMTAYHLDLWDGSFIYSDEHCASIENGILWIDCQETSWIPDMSSTQNLEAKVIYTENGGTWVQDSGHIALWKNRLCMKVLKLPALEYDEVFRLDKHFIARYGAQLYIYNLEKDYVVESFDNIIDCYQNTKGEVLFSTFDHSNFTINSKGKVIELNSNYVRFPRENGKIVEAKNTQILEQVCNLYNDKVLDNNYKVINDNDFIRVDNYGNIILNNKIIGNVSLGPDYFVEQDGLNLSFDNGKLYWLNGSNLIIFEKGQKSNIDIPDGEGKFLSISESGIIIEIYGNNSNTIIIVKDEVVNTVTTKSVDANVACDILYFMEEDTVYSFEWENADASTEVFFKGAYAVSPYIDKAEGAIVIKEEANFEGYGYSNIYSPYGE